MIGHIYLLHFHRPLGNLTNARALASHYIGWALDPEARERAHRAGQGAAMTRAAAAAGIPWDLFVLGEGDRALERRIKNLKATPRLCPICGRRHPGGRLRLPQLVYAQLALDLDDPFDLPAPGTRWDYYELSQQRRWREARALPLGQYDGQVDNVGIAF
jgi:predicted GIY-YIG superfamily endonuclease